MSHQREQVAREKRNPPWTILWWVAMLLLAAWSAKIFERDAGGWQRILAENLPVILFLFVLAIFLVGYYRKRRAK